MDAGGSSCVVPVGFHSLLLASPSPLDIVSWRVSRYWSLESQYEAFTFEVKSQGRVLEDNRFHGVALARDGAVFHAAIDRFQVMNAGLQDLRS